MNVLYPESQCLLQKHIFSLSSISLLIGFVLTHSTCEGEYVKTKIG